MKSSSEGSSFCTMGGMMMTANFHAINMPVVNPTEPASEENKIIGASANNTHRNVTTGNTTSNDTTIDDHNQSSSMNHDDHSSIHNHDHSSHSMPMMSQGTVMYMDGFHSALFHNSQNPPPCLNFLHPSWTLHTPSKFILAMLCVTIMGMLVEACGVWRVRCLRKGRSHRQKQRLKRIRQWEQRQLPNMQGQELEYGRSRMFQREVSELSAVSENGGGEEEIVPMIVDEDCPRPIRRIWKIIPSCIRNVCDKQVSGLDKQGNPKWIRIYDIGAASLHALRAWLGYLLMLAIMTYAKEFMFSAIFGMVFGRYWFVDMDVRGDGGGVMGGAVGVGGGIGGAGLGEGGGAGAAVVAMNTHAHDGTWGGGDPCCGIDEHDEDDHNMNEQPLREPLLGTGNSANAGVKRRNAFD
eukprot:scaffold5840_cov121-Skeletonema_marinoi.AAC.7